MSKVDEQGEIESLRFEDGRYPRGRIIADTEANDARLHHFISILTRLMHSYDVRQVSFGVMTDEEHAVCRTYQQGPSLEELEEVGLSDDDEPRAAERKSDN